MYIMYGIWRIIYNNCRTEEARIEIFQRFTVFLQVYLNFPNIFCVLLKSNLGIIEHNARQKKTDTHFKKLFVEEVNNIIIVKSFRTVLYEKH